MTLAIGSLAAQPSHTAAALSTLAVETANGRFEFQVEIAATPEQRSRGLMFRQSLPADQGMLFDFGAPRPVAMWMRNTYIPLDMLFIDREGRIVQIAPNTVPLSEEVIQSEAPVRAVLELRGGVSALLGIEPGDHVVHPLFPSP